MADPITEKNCRQVKPCEDCPFRKVGGVKHGVSQVLRYASYFMFDPAATFPCHKSVDKSDPRTNWSEWQENQTLCVGGMLFAVKVRKPNRLVMYCIENGWFRPSREALDMVFDSTSQLIAANELTKEK